MTRLAALASIAVGFFACEPARPPAASAPPVAVASVEGTTAPSVVPVTEPSVSASAPPVASSAPSVVATASAPSVAPSASAAPGIPCKSVDDCWVDGQTTAAKPIKRPKHLRGKKFKPCDDGDAAPVCMNGVCGTMGYFC